MCNLGTVKDPLLSNCYINNECTIYRGPFSCSFRDLHGYVEYHYKGTRRFRRQVTNRYQQCTFRLTVIHNHLRVLVSHSI